MKKWTWQWLALLGLAWTILLAVDFVRAELLAPISLKEEDAIEVYHEPLYYDHFLVNIVAPGSPSTAWRIAQQAADSGQPTAVCTSLKKILPIDRVCQTAVLLCDQRQWKGV